jgi:hypothetical protein
MRPSPWLLSAALLLLPVPLTAAGPAPLDSGRLQITIGGRPLGVENFEMRSVGDSLQIFATAFDMLPSRAGPDSLAKRMTMVLGSFDFDLRHYNSDQRFRGEELSRGVEPHDTTYSVFREVDGRGIGDTYARPPGRMFVLDGQLFTSFVVICRHLHGRTFDRLPLWLLALSARDTMMQVEVANLGADTLSWGARPMKTRKYRLSDSRTSYFMWAAEDGRMIKLEQPGSRLLVLREPPPLKRGRKKS